MAHWCPHSTVPSSYVIMCLFVKSCVQLSLKLEAVEQAQEKVASLQALVEDLEGRLEEEKGEREDFAAAWEQEITTLQSQVNYSSY